ncbi:protein eyes shut homolog [Mobula hypostoma]|uniref:protein eyes shut homolog n=1 Tax=Mobula hypostoma TaxID=723540 RepID=UPI002FC29A1A
MCSPGWQGSHCAEDVNECDRNPCQNDATCLEPAVPGMFECVCPPFFTGELCELWFDPCASHNNPCSEFSTCITQSNGTALCICQPGFRGAHCEIDTNECLSNPCWNRGHCLNEVNGYRCICLPGFSGIRCETNINECLSAPCKNNGTCLDLENGFQCNCTAGYHGILCELDVNECVLLPCLNNGSCYNMPGGFQCLCSHGFTGSRCEVNINDCASAPCNNEGTCIDGISLYSCVCLRGFAGTNCEHNVNECASNPCLQGTCMDLVDGFDCHCEPGWMGPRCDTDIEECSSDPCLNGGTCQDLVDAYICTCLNGYSGENCQTDLDVCKDNVLNLTHCHNGGICKDGPGLNFSCWCLSGFAGQFCEKEIDECNSGPCLNNGFCQDYVNGYSCICTQGWTGSHCQVDINECQPNPCVNGVCFQKTPRPGYTCFCSPGFVGVNCEQNYNDCFIYSCPVGYECVDGLNNVSCLPISSTTDTENPGVATFIAASLITPTLTSAVSVVPGSTVGHQDRESQRNSSDNGDVWPSIIPSSVHAPDISLTTVSLATTVSCADSPCLAGATCEDLDIGEVKCHCSSQYEGEGCQADSYFGSAQYYGNSHLEFLGFHLLPQNNISVRFQTYSSYGTLIYTENQQATDVFFFKLFIEQGFLQFQFVCSPSGEVQNVNTSARVNDGRTFDIFIRQDLLPCNAVVTVSGVTTVSSTSYNIWSHLVNQLTGPVFVGGLPISYHPNQIAEPFNNFTGCLEITEINGLGPLIPSNAVSRHNIDHCSFPGVDTNFLVSRATPETTFGDSITFSLHPIRPTSFLPIMVTMVQTLKTSSCQEDVCQNGGTCHDTWLPDGAGSFQCDCPLHFAGHFCENDITLFFPSFNGNAYLKLPSLTTILRRDAAVSGTVVEIDVTLHLTIKAVSSSGTILYTTAENFGSQFLHLFLHDGKPTVKLGCGGSQGPLMVSAKQRINADQLTPIMVR